MLLGNLSLSLALVFALFSATCFLRSARGDEKLLNLGRGAYCAFLFFSVLASAYLMYLFLAHRFEVAYVYGYSSSAEPFFYLVSGFWAGQEGSFLLWLFFGSLLGVLLISGRRKSALRTEESEIREGHVMFFYLLVQIFLLALLLKQSPFSLLPEVPPDGRGLNPLLRDFWMVIHPPVVFVGYAALAIPFAYAMSALTANQYRNWVRLTLPWAGFSCLTLGAGIFIGAYWAYTELGWGGYWGWDPVENASLVPWILSVAMIHGLVLERTRRIFRRTNLLLAILCFLLVIYATFLVRSGVLGDFSVHSFADLGITGYLLIFMIFFLLLSMGLYLARLSGIPRTKTSERILTTEFALFIGIILFSLSALLILLGISSPIISRIFGPASNVSIPYYVRTQLPLAILVCLGLGAVPFLGWKGSGLGEFIKNIRTALVAAIVLTILALVFGVRSSVHLICIFTALLALMSNLIVLVQRSTGRWSLFGGFLTHVGAGMLIVGIVTSSGYDTSEKINLPQGQTEEAFGYQFTYLGLESGSRSDRDALKIQVQKGGSSFLAKPKFYYSEYNQGIMRTPHIKINLLYDLYLSPLEHSQGEEADRNLFQITKGETLEREGYEITFMGFDMGSHAEAGQISVGAVLDVEKDGEKATLTPNQVMGGIEEGQIKRMVHLPGGEDHLVLERIDADRKMVALRLILEEEKTSEDLLVLSVEKKPLINLFWLGTVLLMLGLAVATYRRAKESRERPKES
jgi:cytochrome c-type biogenesis protein CcmF